MTDIRVDWYAEDLLAVAAEMTQQAADELALEIEGQTKLNIRHNDQIDTGFMLNSVYTVSRTSDTYAATQADGRYAGARREKAPKLSLPADVLALVAVAAVYAVYQESDRSFLYRAAETWTGVSGQAILKRVGREYLG